MKCAMLMPMILLAGCATDSATRQAADEPAAGPSSNATQHDKTQAAAVFERFKTMSGTWEGTSGNGGAESLRYETIAGGSCIMETCIHSGQTMVTMYTLDGDRLLLTHYCIAKNQPRMCATRFGGPATDPTEVTFTFIDGGNLPSRDTGHMDKAWFRFIDADHFNSKWTWYQDGKEQWMEEFAYTRTK